MKSTSGCQFRARNERENVCSLYGDRQTAVGNSESPYIQGYLFGKPMPIEEFDKSMRQEYSMSDYGNAIFASNYC
jgi:hypothetical protein